MKNHHLIHIVLLAMMWPVGLIADNYVIINQVMYDSPLNERVTVSPYSNGEFVELYNGSDESVSLHNWCLYGESWTEYFRFQNISIPAKGYIMIAFRHEDSPLFTMDSLYVLPTGSQIVYQNSVVLANAGETILLHNANGQLVDQITYDGSSHISKPDRLSADNPDSIPGNQCVSLHRTWVEFDENGLAVPGVSQWKTDIVSFGECQLAETSFGEHSLTGTQPLPTMENYILSVTPLDPTTRVSISSEGVSVSNGVRTRTAIQYYDGLGRPDELITVESAPDKRDWVQTVSYGDLHRATKQWLPVSMQTDGQRVNVTSYESQAQSYYSDNRPYVETLYEHSALDRVTGASQPGESYASHPSTQTYAVNSFSDNVHIYTVTSSGSLKTVGRNYPSGALYKTTVADEDGKSVTTYTDKLGRTIMENRAGNKTYYVYDKFDRLRFVLPHMSYTKLSNGEYPLTNPTLRAAAYCYQYDNRGNVIYKRLPGCDPHYMVYDQLGQLVLSQDGNQRISDKWTLFAYDSIGRNLYSAEIKLSQNQLHYINFFADKWQVEHYGNNPANVSIAGTGYASTLLGKNNLHLLTLNYYDNYDYLGRLSTPVRQALRFKQEPGYGLQHDNATGLLTGTRVYNLSEEGYTAAAYYYDTQGRVVQSRCTRNVGGYMVTSTEYLFDGSVAQQLITQGTDSDLVREHYRYTYDHAGRAKQVYYQLNNDAEIKLSEFSYDNVGRLVQNLLHNQKDTIRYSYDLRSMLTESHNKHFSEYLLYGDLPVDTHPYATACYNGNISVQTVISAAGEYTLYNEYDGQNRLTRSSMNPRFNNIDLEEVFTYDEVGNIVLLRRHNGFRYIDILNYQYGQDGGNQVLSITDSGTDADRYNTIEYHSADVQADTTMFYDKNGNLVSDADRGTSAIRYNILNLPDTIQFINGNQIVNLYDAAGQKYKSVVYTNLESTVPYYDVAHYSFETDTMWYNITEYAGNIQNRYSRTDTTRRVFNTIGYNTDNACYHYIKDHIGNICAVVNSMQDTAVQSTLYYASGVPLARSFGRDVQPYLYNGKEFIEAHGMNEYDSQARMYYAPIMRTTTMDPLAEKYYHISPYAWCGNNPIMYVDPNGMVVIDIQGHLVREVPETAFDEDDKHYHGFDWIRFVDDNGNVRMDDDGKPMETCFGKEGTIQLIENEDNNTIFTAKGDKVGERLFELMASTLGAAMVEWSHLKTDGDGSGLNYVGTNWAEDKTSIATTIINKYHPIALRQQIHNHPRSPVTPTGLKDKKDAVGNVLKKAGTWGDIGIKNIITGKYGNNVVFKIYGLDPISGEYKYKEY